MFTHYRSLRENVSTLMIRSTNKYPFFNQRLIDVVVSFWCCCSWGLGGEVGGSKFQSEKGASVMQFGEGRGPGIKCILKNSLTFNLIF